jgi:hypothetical protein
VPLSLGSLGAASRAAPPPSPFAPDDAASEAPSPGDDESTTLASWPAGSALLEQLVVALSDIPLATRIWKRFFMHSQYPDPEGWIKVSSGKALCLSGKPVQRGQSGAGI